MTANERPCSLMSSGSSAAVRSVAWIAVPPETSIYYAHNRGASLEQIRGLVQEYLGIAYYWWVGRI